MQLKHSVLLQFWHPEEQEEQLPEDGKNPEMQLMHSVEFKQLMQLVSWVHESQVFPLR